MEIGECTECGAKLGGTTGEALGVQLAVHLHDDHPEAWTKVAESTRSDIETVREALDAL